jgi:hypothetical protein
VNSLERSLPSVAYHFHRCVVVNQQLTTGQSQQPATATTRARPAVARSPATVRLNLNSSPRWSTNMLIPFVSTKQLFPI